MPEQEPQQLRNGSITADPRLDRIPEFDEASRAYGVAKIPGVADLAIKDQLWADTVRLDQGPDGACVGFGWSGELAAEPVPIKGITDKFAKEQIYWGAQRRDQYPGGAYPGASPQSEGSSVLAGAKEVKSRGFITGYHWCFSINDLYLALQTGPVVVGTNWYNSMFDPSRGGWLKVDPNSGVAGGHCYLIRGITVGRAGVSLRLTNSWGTSWGKDGEAYVLGTDFAKLLKDQGEACVPTGRKVAKVSGA